MGDPARMPDVNPFPEDYGPKKPPLSFLLRGSAYPSDTIPDPFQGGEPPRTSGQFVSKYKKAPAQQDAMQTHEITLS